MKKIILGAAVAAALAGANSAIAGGLWLNEFGDLAGGRAAAGASAGVDEAMTIAYNPASASRVKGSQLLLSGGAYIPDVKFDVEYSNPQNGYGNGGDAGLVAPTAGSAYVHDFGSERWSGGVYLAGLAGAGLEYDKDWAGRFQATDVSLLIMALAPTVAYQVTDRLSLGASLQAYYADLEVKLAIPRLRPNVPEGRAKLDGDDTDVGFTLGALYELTDRTRFGISYQSELEPNFEGNVSTKPAGLEVSTNTKLTMAQYVRASVHHDLDERWGVDFTVGWDDWSALDNVLISGERGTAGLPTRWHDTYHYAWGTQYQLDKNWTLTTGVAYDTNPVDAKYRNAQLPADRQIRYAVGARYALRDSMTVGGYLNYADLGSGRISADRFGGEYPNNDVLAVVVNANWTF